ncbi:MAG: hypothetical protein JW762_01850 [Dehalococcoidales bacterium]|nr:hypothetical protein [Dehalococcoidales bacterium]
MKKLLVNLMKIGVLLLLIATVTLFSSCDDTVITTTPEFDPDMNELSLLELWGMIADSTDIQEHTTEMSTFQMSCDAEGRLDRLSFDFGGTNNEGRPCIYFADFNYESKIDIRAYEVDSFPVKRHPALVLEEIDKIGLDVLKPSSEAMTIHISFTSGDVGYRNDNLDIFHLENGVLVPLDEIIFHNQASWCTISVYHLVPNDSVVDENGQTTTTTAPAPVPPGERTSQTWFLSEDINMADTVTYLGKTSFAE